MPHPLQREPASPPQCTVCEKTMRLVTIQPAYFYRDLDEYAYSCECGQVAAKFVRKQKSATSLPPD
jgi:hypothetical protein